MTIKLSKNGKRLGRPPKNLTTGKVFISAIPVKKEDKPELINTEEMIECELLPVQQYSHLQGTETKSGRYMTNYYDVPDFGRKCWVVGAYIKTDWEKHKQNLETIQKCINYLNSLGKKKKIYGNLKIFKESVKFLEKSKQKVAVVEMVIEDRKNENFWGEGERY
jgi:hypothetical protein